MSLREYRLFFEVVFRPRLSRHFRRDHVVFAGMLSLIRCSSFSFCFAFVVQGYVELRFLPLVKNTTRIKLNCKQCNILFTRRMASYQDTCTSPNTLVRSDTIGNFGWQGIFTKKIPINSLTNPATQINDNTHRSLRCLA